MSVRYGRVIAATVFAIATGISAAALAAGTGGGSGSKDDSKKDDTQYRSGVDKIKSKDFAGAVALLNNVVTRDPKNADAWNYIGYADRMMGKYSESLSAYEKALAIEPNHIQAREYLGELYIQTGETAKARQQLATIEQLCGENCDEYKELKGAISGSKAALLDDAGSKKGW